MNNRTYRGVPLPEKCTREVLRKMVKKLETYPLYESYFTCNQYAIIIYNKLSHELRTHSGYMKIIENWSGFIERLEIDISGTGFRPMYLPDWFKVKFNVSEDCDNSIECANKNRLNFLRDILKECYNE